jgi:hypothetical protein
MKIKLSIIPSYSTLHKYLTLPDTCLPGYYPFIFLEIDPFDTQLPITPIFYFPFTFTPYITSRCYGRDPLLPLFFLYKTAPCYLPFFLIFLDSLLPPFTLFWTFHIVYLTFLIFKCGFRCRLRWLVKSIRPASQLRVVAYPPSSRPPLTAGPFVSAYHLLPVAYNSAVFLGYSFKIYRRLYIVLPVLTTLLMIQPIYHIYVYF